LEFPFGPQTVGRFREAGESIDAMATSSSDAFLGSTNLCLGEIARAYDSSSKWPMRPHWRIAPRCPAAGMGAGWSGASATSGIWTAGLSSNQAVGRTDAVPRAGPCPPKAAHFPTKAKQVSSQYSCLGARRRWHCTFRL